MLTVIKEAFVKAGKILLLSVAFIKMKIVKT